MWRVTLACKIAIGQATAKDVSHSSRETVGVVQLADAILAMIETKHLFVNVARQMKRFYSNVGSLERAL